MKKLYEFNLYKREKVKEKSESTNDKGEKVITEKEVEKKVTHKFFLRKPTRSMYDEAELFYGVKLAEGVKAGLLNHALLAKRYNNDGGIFTEDQKEDFANSYFELLNDQTDWQQLVIKGDEKNEEEKDKQIEIEKRMALNRRKLQSYEADKTSLFDQTAETRARNKTVFWWVLNMSHRIIENNEENEESPIFEGASFEERLASYDKLEESEDEMDQDLIQRLVYYISFWYAGRVTSAEDFMSLDDDAKEYGFEDQSLTEEADEKENDEVEEGPKEEKPKEKPKKKPVKRRKKKEKELVKELKKEEPPVEELKKEELPVEELKKEELPVEELGKGG